MKQDMGNSRSRNGGEGTTAINLPGRLLNFYVPGFWRLRLLWQRRTNWEVVNETVKHEEDTSPGSISFRLESIVTSRL